MHGEDEHRRALIVQTQPANEGEAAESAGAHGEIDDNYVGALHPVEAKAVRQTLRLHDILDASILKQLPAALQHNGMIVDDEDPSNTCLRLVQALARVRFSRVAPEFRCE